MPSTFQNMYGERLSGHRMYERTGLPIYDSFPEFEVDNWSAETRARGKTKRKNVYLYDSGKQGNGGMYSDRMWQWDGEKMAEAVQLLAGGWRNSTATDYNAMLRKYLGKRVEVTQVIMMEDGRGYELFYIAFYDKKEAAPVSPQTPETV